MSCCWFCHDVAYLSIMCAIKISNICTNYYSCGIMVQLGRDV